MELAEVERRVGQKVVYFGGPEPEVGQIVRAGQTYAFVLYDGDTTPKATLPQDLEPA
jgi:hypothetical protein